MVIVESDFIMAIAWVSSFSVAPWKFHFLKNIKIHFLKNIKMLSYLIQVVFKHALRAANGMADFGESRGRLFISFCLSFL